MTNVLVKKILFLAFMLSMMGVASAQSLSYRNSYQLKGGATHINSETLSGVSDFTFGDNGNKLYAINISTNEISQYDLTEPYDISSGLSLDGSFSIPTEETNPSGVALSSDGSKIFVVGYTTDLIYQYELTINFDITAGVTLNPTTMSISPQDGVPYDFSFSPDGSTLFVLGANGSDINQYSLDTPFDITSGVTYENNAFDYSDQVNNVRAFTFSPEGRKLFVLDYTDDRIFQYSVNTPYDLSSEVTYDQVKFTIGPQIYYPSSLEFSGDGSSLFAAGNSTLAEYQLTLSAFQESDVNDGSIESQGAVQVSGEQFTNAGSSLTEGVDYSINNLPAGFSSSLEVGANGIFAYLSISGSATNHQDANDIASLEFTFNNSAFVGGSAAGVSNAVAASSGIEIDFNDNNPAITYDFSYSFHDLTEETSALISSQETSPTGLRFSADGMKLFVIGSIGDDVNQYTLQNPFDVSSLIFDGAFSVSSQELTPQDFIFSNDGMKMFVIGNNRQIYQYSLTNAFDVTSGVTYDDDPFSVVSQEIGPTGIAFSNDGMKLFIVGTSGDEVNQYSLTNAFDITSGVTHFGTPFSISSETSNPYGITFNDNGTQMIVSAFPGFVFLYDVPTPFDITSGVTYTDISLDVTGIGRFPGGVVWSSDGSNFFLIDSDADRVYQYGVPTSSFAETSDNLGEVEGSLHIELVDDFFVNAGSALTEGVHFNLPNKPAGLSASIAVDANAQNATLTLTGTANNHQAINTVNPFEITFLDAAFENSTALQVANGVEANTGISIDFRDNNKALTYGSAFDIENATLEGTGFISGDYNSLTYNNDGTRLFITTNFNRVYEILLGTPYDVTDGLSFGDNLIASDFSRLTGIEFNGDGTKMFLLDHLAAEVGEYSLSTPYDITSAAYTGSYDVSNEEANPYAFAFDPSGNKMYIAGYNSDKIHQYSLTNSFDVLSTTTYDGDPLSIKSYEDIIYDIEFGDGGSKLYIVGSASDAVHQFELETPYDITSGSEHSFSLDVSSQTTAPTGILITPEGEKLQVLGFSGFTLSQYDFGLAGFNEIEDNNGEIEGELVIHIVDDTFTNAGGNLSYSTDYTMANVPSGLTPNLSVASDGFSATLTFTGIADDHQDIHDVSSLGFDFNNSAFADGNASEVDNAESAESGIGIDFADNNATLSYGYRYSIANGAQAKDFFNLKDIDTSPQDFAFSADGLTMFIVGNTNDEILQFSLDAPYKMGSGVTLEGGFDISGFEITPTGITFNPTGTKMYVTGLQNNSLYQFSLTNPFEVTSGVTHDGTPITGLGSLRTVAFNDDGTTFFIMSGSSSAVIRQYEVTTPYDLTSGVNQVDALSISLTNPRGLAFSDNGFEMFISSYDDIVQGYRLTKPFDLNTDPTLENTLDVNADVFWNSGIAFSTSGDKMLLLGGQSSLQRVVEYDLNVGGFKESFDNNGEVEGSIVIRAFDAQFANAGGTLTPSTDYTLTGVPAGLSPTLSVASDGFSATLTLSGTADDHQDVDDVSDFTFTFNDSAFETLAASLVGNTSSYNSGLGIDYLDNSPGIQYGNAFDVLAGTTYSGNSFDAGSDPLDVTFSPDGTKMFITNFNDQLVQYTLSEPYDVSTAIVNTPSFGLNTDEVTTGVTFSANGMKLFTAANSRLIHQYSLTNPFDITSGVTDDEVPLDILNQETSPAGITFSLDGTKMFIVGSGSDEVNQYSLSNPFDISSGVTFDGSPYSIISEEGQSADIQFSNNGRKMLIIGYDNDQVYQYDLTIPFDITLGVSYEGGYDISNEEGQSSGFAFNSSGNKLFVIGRNNDTVYEYDLNVGTFEETALNDGDVEGTVTLYIYDDKFTNASGTLTHTSDYTINNLPSGLTPNLSVAADGLSATLSISGQVSDHQDIHSVDGLEFTFTNSAFVTNNAADIAGAVATNSYLPVKLRDNVPALTYGAFYDLENIAFDGSPLSVSAQDNTPTNITFSANGKKLFLTGRQNDAIYQYALTTAFDVTGSATFEGSLDISVETRDAMDLQFSPDGMRLLVLSDNISSNFGSLIAQYNLTQAFDITSGVTYSGNSYDLPSSTISNPSGFTFSANGTQVFITNGFHASEVIYYYTLNSAFDISGGLTYDGNFSYPVESESLNDLAFNSDGTSLFVMFGPLSDQINELILASPYDLTGSVTLGNTFSVSSQEDFPQGFIFGPNGNKLYVVGATGDEINQYTLTDEGFVENSSNDGSIDGSLEIKLIDDFFANAGGSLSTPANYVISNLPAGLNSNINVDAGGQIATLTLTGNASSHLDEEDIVSLEFTFENSAFVNYDASEVINAVAVSSGVGIDFIASTETDITAFTLAEETESATIDDGNHTVEIEVVFGTNITALSPTITISEGATISPESDVEDDFTTPVTYTVTAEDGTTIQDWEVTVTVAPNTENDIASFTFTEIDGTATIDAGAHTVVAEAVAGTDISAITPSISVSTNASISPNTGVEQDFTTAVTYTVTAEDGTTQDWDVTITEALADPTNIFLSNANIDENMATNSLVGTLSSEDISFSDVHTYTFVTGGGDDDNDSFTITGDQLTLDVSADFETQDVYNVRIQTNDGNGGLFGKNFTISINDVNEAPTDIFLTNSTIDESNPAGTVVGTLSPEDVDQSDAHTYSLKAGNTDNDSFEISGSDLVTSVELDFETQDVYNLEIIVTDQGGLTFEQEFAVSVNDLPAQITSIELSNVAIAEDQNIGTVVGTFSTFGEDLSGSYTYDLVAGVGSDDNTSFSVSTNQLLTGTSFDFETKNTYSVRVMVDDGTLTFEKVFTITINDISEAPTDIALSPNSITENNSVGDVIGNLSTTDEDAGETYIYDFVSGTGDTDNASFNIAGNELQSAVVFDFETQNSYSVRIETNDGNGGTFSKSFTITITDENESIVVVSPIADQNLDEGFETLEIDLSEVFEDQDGDALTYTIESSDTDIVTVNNSGSILTITEVGGFGTSTITVAADDGSGVTTSDEFIVTVTNVNDAPIVINPLDDQNVEEEFGVAQISYANTFEDADGDLLMITVSSSDENVVTVEVITNNQIQVSEVGIGTSTITLTADDGNGGTVSDEFTFTVNEAPNNAPVVVNPLNDQTEVEEGFGSTQFSYADVFEDADGDALTITVSSSDENVVTAEVIANNQIQVNEVGLGTSTITITADDGNGGTVSDEFIFTVNEKALGLEDLEVKIYPNPSTDFIYVQSTKELSVRLTDLNGKDIQTKSGSQLEFDIQSLSSGLYILQVSDGDRSSNYRVIKAK